jgi:hypothetical protein
VTAAALIILQDEWDNYALVRHRHSTDRLLNPIGGGIKATVSGKQWLEEVLDATDFENGLDLRFRLPMLELEKFRAWIFDLSNEGIESNPAGREFSEEMGPQEYGLLTPEQASQAVFQYAGWAEHIQPTTSRGQEGVLTYYFFRIYRAFVPDWMMDRLQEQSGRQADMLEFTSDSHILKRCSRFDSTIRERCMYLIFFQ